MPGYGDFEGHHHLVALNDKEPQMAGFVAAVMKYWLGCGADGWRLDPAYAVPPTFWNSVVAEVPTQDGTPELDAAGSLGRRAWAHRAQLLRMPRIRVLPEGGEQSPLDLGCCHSLPQTGLLRR